MQVLERRKVMINPGLTVRHKNPKIKGSGITDGRHMNDFGEIYVFVTWDDGRRDPYGIWMDIRGLIIRVPAKTRHLNVRPFKIFDELAEHYKWSAVGDPRPRHR